MGRVTLGPWKPPPPGLNQILATCLCIVHKKMTIEIINTDRTGPDSVEQAGRTGQRQTGAAQGRAGWNRATPDRDGQGREGRGRAKQEQTGFDRTGQGQTVPNSARQVRTGRTEPGRIR